MANSPPVWDRIEAVLRESGQPLKAIDIAKKSGVEKIKVNKELYQRRGSGEVVMASDGPPKWRLGPSKAGQISSPAPSAGAAVSSDAAAIESEMAKVTLANPTSPHDHHGHGQVTLPAQTTRDATVPSSAPHCSTIAATSQPPLLDKVAETSSQEGGQSQASCASITELEASILHVLNQAPSSAESGLTALVIARSVGKEKASDANKVLYSLQSRGLVRKVTDSGSPRPRWLPGPAHGGSSPSQVTRVAPPSPSQQQTGESWSVSRIETEASKGATSGSRRLYAREDSSDGKITFKPVVPLAGENVLPLIKAETDQEDVTEKSEPPPVDSWLPDSLVAGSESLAPAELEAKILKLLGQHTTMTAGDIRNELGLETRAPVLNALFKLKEDGRVSEHPNSETFISCWSLNASG